MVTTTTTVAATTTTTPDDDRHHDAALYHGHYDDHFGHLHGATGCVIITSPADHASVPRGSVTIQVAVSSPAAVWKVAFYIDGKLRTQDYLTPFAYVWNTRSLAKGSSHTIKVVAYDLRNVTLGQGTATVTVK